MSLDPALVEETDDCIRRIKAFHKKHGRRVHKLIVPSEQGWADLHHLEGLDLPIPDDLKALYKHFDGAARTDTMKIPEAAVFLDFEWFEMSLIHDLTLIARHEDMPFAEERIQFTTSGATFTNIDLFPLRAKNGAAPLMANQAYSSRKLFTAFDSTIAMLRSVCAAHDAGVIRFAARDDPANGIAKHQTLYDPAELWDAIRPHTPGADYWPALIDGPIDWELLPPPPPKPGAIPGVVEMPEGMIGPERSKREAEDEFRREAREAGWTEAQIEAAFKIPED